MYASALPLAVAFFLLFAPPSGLSETGLFIWLTVTVVLTRAAMTLYHVPHVALGAELSPDYDERTQIVSIRYVFSFSGYLLAYYAGFGYFFADSPEFPRGQFNADAYMPFALSMCFFMVITIFMAGFGTHHRIPFLPKPKTFERLDSVTAVLKRTFIDMAVALRNRSFFWLFLGTLMIFVMVGVDSGLGLYMLEYFWELDSDQKLVLMLLYPIGIMCGSLLTPLLHRRTDKRTGIFIGVTWWALCQIVPVLLMFAGWFPTAGTQELALTLTVIKFTQGVAAAQSLVSFNSMLADIADEHEVTTGKRQEGVFFAAASFSNKTTSGLGSLAAGVGLDIISWPRGDHIQSAADIPAETLAQLALMYGPIVAGFGVLSVWFLYQCKMTRKDHEAIVAKLDIIRSETALSRDGSANV